MQEVKFGGTAREQDELARLVNSGEKVATSTLKFFQEQGLSAPSYVGDKWAIMNSQDKPICSVEVTQVLSRSFGEVDEAFAKAEGDGSLENWQTIHANYYGQLLLEHQQKLTEATLLECIYFRKLG
ncbi:hypothetical protein IGI37_003161 [Enterococcus sp. AZ194]|uniref:ASCH domain-containing protein n=1 Tax=Enterococcus sp. AZ194 TaxID=2774629 RepID=UPI003F29ADB9